MDIDLRFIGTTINSSFYSTVQKLYDTQISPRKSSLLRIIDCLLLSGPINDKIIQKTEAEEHVVKRFGSRGPRALTTMLNL